MKEILLSKAIGADTAEPADKPLHDNPYADFLLRTVKFVPKDDDYIGPDGLVWCGKCRTPRQYFVTKDNIFKGMTLPVPCACRKAAAEARDRELFESRVRALRKKCFSVPAMADWTFARDNGSCPQSAMAQRYVAKWEHIRQNNYGLYLWGDVGVGKSFLAGCIANALIEQEIPVRMLGFSELLADFSANLEGRAAYIRQLCAYPLLILDDYGTERNTEFVQEQIFAVLDARCRARLPLIITSNIPADRLRAPAGQMQARINERILEMCLTVHVRGENQRIRATAEKIAKMHETMNADCGGQPG